MRTALTLVLMVASSSAQEPTPPATHGQLVDRVFARVNGEVITQSDIEKKAGFSLAQAGRDVDPERIIRAIIMQKLQEQAAEELGISITEDELDRQVEFVVRRRFGGDFGQLLQALSADGLSLSDFRDQREEDLKKRRFFQRKGFDLEVDTGLTRRRSPFDLDVTVTDLRRYYLAHEENYVEPARIRLLRVRVPHDEHPSIDAARESAEKLRGQLESEGWLNMQPKIIERYGETAMLDMGLQPVSAFSADPALGAVVRSLPLGKWSDPIRRPQAFEVFFIAERLEERRLSFDEAQQAIRAELSQKKTAAAEERIVRQLILESDPETRRLLLGEPEAAGR